MKPEQRDDLSLSGADWMLLRAGLRAYLHQFEAHAAQDAYASHDRDQVTASRREVGELLWRLQDAGAPPGARIEHSEEAVEPPAGD